MGCGTRDRLRKAVPSGRGLRASHDTWMDKVVTIKDVYSAETPVSYWYLLDEGSEDLRLFLKAALRPLQ